MMSQPRHREALASLSRGVAAGLISVVVPVVGRVQEWSSPGSVCLRLNRRRLDLSVIRRRVGNGPVTLPRPENGQLPGYKVSHGSREEPGEVLDGAHGQGMIIVELKRDAIRHPEGRVIAGLKSRVADERARSLGKCQAQPGDLHNRFHLGPSMEKMHARVGPGGFEFRINRHQLPSERDFLGMVLHVDSDAIICHCDGDEVAAVGDRALQPSSRQFGTTPPVLQEGYLGALHTQVASCEYTHCSVADHETSTVYLVVERGCAFKLLSRQQRLGP